MSYLYDEYLREHRNNVKKGYDWIRQNMPEYIPDDKSGLIEYAILNHDRTKNDNEEYSAYDDYFYKCKDNRSYDVVNRFNLAFLHHLHNNPHHWQYWVLINDCGEDEEEIVFEMPYEYLIEMICDWWSFSWSTGNLLEIFNWYTEHRDTIKLAPETRNIVESILSDMKVILTGKVVDLFSSEYIEVSE